MDSSSSANYSSTHPNAQSQAPGSLAHPLLVVEDSDEDFEALTRMMKKIGAANPVYRCVDGEDALDYLNQEGQYEQPGSAVRPSLVLLDLNLPGTDGREVLEHIKTTDNLRTIPVVVLTTSSNPKDIQICYDYCVNSYLVKPMNLQRFQQVIQSFIEYWLDVAVLPSPVTSVWI